MDKNNEKIIVTTTEKLNEMSVEQSVDTEFTLPDYYPEISKILKCMTEVNVMSKQIKGTSAEIGGQVAITLLYSDKENGINSYSHTCPFTKSVDIGKAYDEAYLYCVLKGEFINSKATAPRKVEVHGSVTFGMTVEIPINTSCVCDCQQEGVFTKCQEIKYNEILIPITKSVFLEDEISIGNNKSISKILRCNAVSVINECKVVTNKVVVKGELNIDVLYCPVQSNKPILIQHSHGFSQIFDRDKLDESCTCTATSSVCSFEIRPKTSLDGEVKSMMFESKVNVDLFTERENTVCLVHDAFTNVHKSDAECCELLLPSICEKIKENYLCKKNLDFTDGAISEIYDLWCKTAVNFASCDSGEMLLKGVVLICILGTDSNGVPVFFERSVDYEYRYNYGLTDNECKCRYEVSIAAIDFTKNFESGVDVSIELTVKADIFTIDKIKTLTNLTIDKTMVLERDNDTAITLYFAENETVWDIAKKYLADPEKICLANNLENCNSICNNILLIPNA